MDIFNSQQLTYLDGYLHAFRQPGNYEYRVLFLPRGYEGSEPHNVYTINVQEKGNKSGEGKQVDVTLQWDVNRRTFQPEPAQLTVGVNDFVLWHVATNTLTIPFYSIRGEFAEKQVFDSRVLMQHDVFTHFFMTFGEYAYRINGKAEGHISVRNHQQVERTEYQKQTTQAPVIHIVQGRPQPDKLTIVAGQTVVWFVEEGAEVTIAVEKTEARHPRKSR